MSMEAFLTSGLRQNPRVICSPKLPIPEILPLPPGRRIHSQVGCSLKDGLIRN